MLRAWIGCVALCGLVMSGVLAVAQDSGPGPTGDATSQQYDVTVLKLGSSQIGTFTFDVTPPTTEEPATTSIFTTGTFTSAVGTSTGTGTWHAIDFGDWALWVATSQGTAGNQYLTGYATPDNIVGKIITPSSTSGRARFLRALFSSSFFFGTVAEPTTEPMTTAN